MKYYIAIKDNKVVANWGGVSELTQQQIVKICGGNAPEQVQEVQVNRAIATGSSLACYRADWSRKTAEELAAEGLDPDGQPLPPPPTAEELAAKAEQEAAKKQRRDLQRKADLARSFIEEEEQAAQQQAMDKLLARRKAKLLAKSPKAQDLEKAKQDLERFEQELAEQLPQEPAQEREQTEKTE